MLAVVSSTRLQEPDFFFLMKKINFVLLFMWNAYYSLIHSRNMESFKPHEAKTLEAAEITELGHNL